MQSMALNTNGFSALKIQAPTPKAAKTLGITATDIQRYRTHKKRRKHDTIPSWMIASAIDAMLGDRLICRMLGGFMGQVFGKNPEGDLAHTIESLTDMFQSATEIAWDMATGDDIAINNNTPQQTPTNEKSVTAAPSLANESAGKIGAWRQQNQENKMPSLGYNRQALAFAAP